MSCGVYLMEMSLCHTSYFFACIVTYTRTWTSCKCFDASSSWWCSAITRLTNSLPQTQHFRFIDCPWVVRGNSSPNYSSSVGKGPNSFSKWLKRNLYKSLFLWVDRNKVARNLRSHWRSFSILTPVVYIRFREWHLTPLKPGQQVLFPILFDFWTFGTTSFLMK